jgi:amidohydrolase
MMEVSMRKLLLAVALTAAAGAAHAASLGDRIDAAADAVEPKVIEWRRDIHQHPELGYQEVRTAGLVADHLKRLGYDVRTGVATTGVVAVLTGGKPGPVVALRADMDALPVKEETPVPFASKATGLWRGAQTPVMHACGHDGHVAVLMGVAEVLAGLRDDLPGTVKLLFQPAEEGSGDSRPSGAARMIDEGAMENPKPGAIFGLHASPAMRIGNIALRPAGMLASSDGLRIEIVGRGGHGGSPWHSVDPIVVAAQVVLSLQTITSRQVDLTKSPAVVTIGSIQGGNRGNIIPDNVVMEGTIRSFDDGVRRRLHDRIKETAELVAKSAGAEAKVSIGRGYPVTYNDPPLTEWSNVTLRRIAGAESVHVAPQVTGAEDFSLFTRAAPGVFFFLGVTPADKDPAQMAPNHSPRFFLDEAGLKLGVRALAHLAVDYLEGRGR